MIELRNIKKYYKMGNTTVKALDGINLKVEDGEFVTIIGPSGSGKSTMMNIIGCLDKATSGEYFVDGIEISRFSENKLAFLRNKKMGFIFQGFNLLKNLTAYENVEFPLIYQGLGAKQRKARVIKSLEMVGMGDRMTHKPNELSGGQQQRVAIARALATKPMCILADEPTGNLDSKTGNEIMEILRDLNRQGTTVIIITHNDEIAKLSRRIVHIYDGKIKSDEINEDIEPLYKNNASFISQTNENDLFDDDFEGDEFNQIKNDFELDINDNSQQSCNSQNLNLSKTNKSTSFSSDKQTEKGFFQQSLQKDKNNITKNSDSLSSEQKAKTKIKIISKKTLKKKEIKEE